MSTELSKKPEPPQALIKQGLFDQAVITGIQMLEALYRWLYKEVQPRLKPEEQQAVSNALEKQGKPFADLTMDELVGLFEEMRLYELAERELKRDFSFFKTTQAWRDLRNRAMHQQGEPGDRPITKQEAEAFLSTVDLHLHQAGLVVAEGPARVGSKVRRLCLRVQVPSGKMADFVHGVLTPLREDGAEIDVEVSLIARSPEGFPKATLDRNVKEALNQIGATILDEEQE